MSESDSKPLFALGDIYLSSSVSKLLLRPTKEIELDDLFRRHVRGDWGDLSRDGQVINRSTLAEGEIVMSMYRVAHPEEIRTNKRIENKAERSEAQLWIITEIDRGVTMVMLSTEMGGRNGAL